MEPQPTHAPGLERYQLKSVLTIAGSDSSGGAGIQADIKAIQAHRLFAQSAITALTAQNTKGVHGVLAVDPGFIESQIDAVFDDIRPHAVKIGMVPTADAARAIAGALQRNGAQHIVVDPVMVATSGDALSSDSAVSALVESLIPLAEVITPNVAEAEVLAGFSIRTREDMLAALEKIGEKLPGAVLLKGGHALADAPGRADDFLRLADGRVVVIEGERVDNPNAHGTGCTLSSAIASGLAQGLTVEDAVRQAKAYVAGALRAGLDLGAGQGPLDHDWRREVPSECMA